MKKSERIILICIVVILTGIFAYWALSDASSGIGLAFAGASMLLFGALCIRFVPQLCLSLRADAPLSPDSALGARSLRWKIRHPWLRIIMFVILTRLFLLVVGYAAYTLFEGYNGGIIDTLRLIWLRSDSPSYLGIAENWYVTEGDARFHIVFFPLYPLFISFFNLMIKNSFASAMIVSFLSTVAGAIFAYETAALDMERDEAMRVVKYLLIAPAAFFFAAPMTEALFMLLCFACVYFVRKKHYAIGCIIGALAAFTRSLGIFLAVFAFVEYLIEIFTSKRLELLSAQKKTHILRALCLFIIPLGLLGYLYINYAVTGDIFTFSHYQSEHWNQGFGLFFSTAAYQSEYAVNALAEGNMRTLWGLFVPNLVYSFAALGIMLPAVKRIRSSYSSFFIAYFAVAIGATWLLSAPRYLSAAFCLPIALASLTRDRRVDAICTVLCIAGQVVYLAMYAIGWPVY